MEKVEKSYHDYVIKDGKFIGDFEGYLQCRLINNTFVSI